MPSTIWLFVGFGAFVVAMLALDLGVFHRRAHAVSVREAGIWSLVWLSLALLFALGIFLWEGRDKGIQFLTAYIVEKSLSVDNIFVFLVIFSYFAVPDAYRHRVLFLGILGAIVIRGIFIATGVTLLEKFDWMVYLFGAFLVITAIRLALRGDEEVDPERNPVVRLVRRLLPVTEKYEGQSFFVRRGGKWMATPLFVVLVAVEVTDVVFAVDSVPAVLAISRDPFIVWTSNVFAILGMRALFFLVAGILPYFRYLKAGLVIVLGYVGVKMLISDVYHLPTFASLGIVVGILSATMLASYVARLRESCRPARAVGTAPGDARSLRSETGSAAGREAGSDGR
ncbi:MAG: TerC family protein [Gemmatimonadetes bacterium]|nr:TerC family protein [Gemmatimonadota bacterium]